jgi:EAL domain-containing protein (putative c-di-GMP-specific phosphodiesterase class I)/FixJ family two-component response regulator
MYRQNRHAYVLDDEAPIGAVVCKVLDQCGLQATAFDKPDTFFSAFEVLPPELIILDLSLGRSDAIEVLRKLESLSYRGKVILMSGRSMQLLNDIDAIGKARGLTMLPPLAKPFKPADLKSRLECTPQSASPRTETATRREPHPIKLEQALQNSWLELWYQPKVELQTFSICGAEALLRVNHPEFGILSPGQFLPPPGDPLHLPLSKFVIAEAMREWKIMAQQNVRPTLSLNMPASVVVHPSFVADVRNNLPDDTQFPGLIIEITEDEIVRDVLAIREAAMQLKLSSVELSIDDFGTAYASLARLRDLPCGEVKLDISFVSNCAGDESKRNICQIVLDISRKFNLKACAEGVENVEDLKALVAMGFDYAQGYIFGKPMPAQKFVNVMLRQAWDSVYRDWTTTRPETGFDTARSAALAAYSKRLAAARPGATPLAHTVLKNG